MASAKLRRLGVTNVTNVFALTEKTTALNYFTSKKLAKFLDQSCNDFDLNKTLKLQTENGGTMFRLGKLL
jgi:hypothetical protein